VDDIIWDIPEDMAGLDILVNFWYMAFLPLSLQMDNRPIRYYDKTMKGKTAHTIDRNAYRRKFNAASGCPYEKFRSVYPAILSDRMKPLQEFNILSRFINKIIVKLVFRV